jgi:hypothetical protein
MAHGMGDAATFEVNNNEVTKVTCISCAELELELKGTQLELKATEYIVELLRNELKLSSLNSKMAESREICERSANLYHPAGKVNTDTTGNERDDDWILETAKRKRNHIALNRNLI